MQIGRRVKRIVNPKRIIENPIPFNVPFIPKKTPIKVPEKAPLVPKKTEESHGS